MEKKKPIRLQAYVIRALLLFFAGLITILFLVLVLFQFSLHVGIVAPANAGEAEAQAEISRQEQAGSFSHDLNPQFYEYIYFDASGKVETSSLTGKALAEELAKYEDRTAYYTTGAYLFFADGSSCLFSWTYTASFTNPLMQSILPSAEVVLFIFALIALLVFFLLFAQSMSKQLGNKLALVEAASTQIAQQDLDTPLGTSVGILEFNHALQSMENMRLALQEALLAQWESEQQRKQEIAALAHDLKSPLTVISGNAELLLEEPLHDEQGARARAIYRSGKRAYHYLETLQHVSSFDILTEKEEQLTLEALMCDLDTALLPLARDRSILIDYSYDKDLGAVTVYPSLLMRALINIGENAVFLTKAGGQVKISVAQTTQGTVFSFEDEGPGFSAEALLHAKEVFWQQDKSRTNNRHYGLGLALAEQASQKHAGRLLLENTAQGACVKLIIKNIEQGV